MPRIAIITLLLLSLLALPARAQAPCTRAEFLDIFKHTADRQLALDAALATADDLLSFSESAIAERQTILAAPATCADALEFQRLSIEVTGDYIARQALDLARVPQGDNPYRLRFAGEQERIGAALSAMLSRDRSAAPAADERSLPTCSDAELSELDGLVGELLTLLDGGATSDDLVSALLAIDARLHWREKALPRQPGCAEWAALLPRLGAAVTDSATAYAIAATVYGADNPYADLAALHVASLRQWLSPAPATLAVPSGATIKSGGLPACSADELAQAHDQLAPQYGGLIDAAGQIEDVSDLRDYSEAYLQFRGNQLADLPLCAEAFAVGWQARQLLDDLAVRAALDVAAAYSEQHARRTQIEEESARVAAAIDGLGDQLAGINGLSAGMPKASLLACGTSEILFLYYYLRPEFDAFSFAALSLAAPERLPALVERSLVLRELLWLELPRCAEALEIGLVMRRVAADLVAMIGLEAAGSAAIDIPYLHGIAADMSWLAARLEELAGDMGSSAPADTRYYVIAERGANIRACASTDCPIITTALAGEIVYASDDRGSWYRLNLPDNQTGYIAAFLLSRSPPTG
ncbi:MAG: SH3 domain-containing protein [Chloroflexi bacterium]|nr:SH3 domain-containing protein [Chloroflexota bacterium]